MATKRTNGRANLATANTVEVETWQPPNGEGKEPHAAFTAFLNYAKKVLAPSTLHELLQPHLLALGTTGPELSIIDMRDALRPTCEPERSILRDRLASLTTSIEGYVKTHKGNVFVADRLSWMIQGVTHWQPTVDTSDDINRTTEENLSELVERFREDERWAGVDPMERVIGTAISKGFLNATFRTDDLRKEVVQRLHEIAENIPSGKSPAMVNGHTDRLPWTSSTNAFAHIFTTLSTAGYFPMPRKGAKNNEPNFTGLARVLLQAFDVKGEDGSSLTAEQLRVRLTDAAPRPLAETKKAKFQIPDANTLVVPKAEELE